MAIFLLLGISYALIGVTYLSIDQFMPYHSEAIQTEWSALNADYQGLFLGLIKGLGGGAFVAGFAISFMAVNSLRTSRRPFIVLLPATSLGYSTLLCYATYIVYTNTAGRPPLWLNYVFVAMAVSGSALLVWSRRSLQIA